MCMREEEMKVEWVVYENKLASLLSLYVCVCMCIECVTVEKLEGLKDHMFNRAHKEAKSLRMRLAVIRLDAELYKEFNGTWIK